MFENCFTISRFYSIITYDFIIFLSVDSPIIQIRDLICNITCFAIFFFKDFEISESLLREKFMWRVYESLDKMYE